MYMTRTSLQSIDDVITFIFDLAALSMTRGERSDSLGMRRMQG